METKETISQDFKSELEKASFNEILTSKYRKKKLILWSIRTLIIVILYVVFWKYNWVKWSLIITIPLSLISLLTIIFMPYFLKRKLKVLKIKCRSLIISKNWKVI